MGKGSSRRKGANDVRYRDNYDGIFRGRQDSTEPKAADGGSTPPAYRKGKGK